MDSSYDLATRAGRLAYLQSQWRAVAAQKEDSRKRAEAWMKSLDGEGLGNLIHFVRNPEDFENAVFNSRSAP